MEPASLRNMVPPERSAPFLGFVWTVILCAAAASIGPLLALPGQVDALPLSFWVTAGLAVLIDARPFTPAGRRLGAAILASVCLTFAIMLGWGLGPAIVVQAAAVAVSGWRMRSTVWRTGFNVAQHLLALAVAGAVLSAGPELAFRSGGNPTWTDVLAVVAASAAWFAITYGTVTTAVWLRFGGRWPAMFISGLGFELLSAASLLFLSPLLVVAAHRSAALIPLILVPLYAVYRMARLSTAHEKIARLDPLTGLGNRKALLTEVADQAAAHAERAARGGTDRYMALLVLDLDRFKRVNDALGHAVGDRLLTEVAKRLATVVEPPAVLARLGGDEFAVLAPRLPDAAAARRLATGIAEALDEPVLLDGLPLDIGGSIGVAVYPDHGTDFETLMRHADVAMYEAKHRGDAVAVYAPEADHNSPERLSLLGDLRTALEVTGGVATLPPRDAGPDGTAEVPQLPGAGEIRMYYQPQVAIDTGEVIGVEALLRWRHPERGMVHPEELIKAAEHTAVMRLLTRRVIDDVIEQLAKWRDAGLPMRAALNVSVRDLHTGEIVDQIEDRLNRYGLPADRLQLEITESALMADPRRVLVTLSRLARLGIAIALDDFGTGYSSMQHLRRLPLSEVKIDRSFVLGMAEDGDDAAIVRSMIELAGALGLRVVAEGVEDERTWRLLRAAGCDVAQGWFYGRPMPADEFGVWLSRYRPPLLQESRTDKPAGPGDRADMGASPEGGADEPGSREDRAATPTVAAGRAKRPAPRENSPAEPALRRAKRPARRERHPVDPLPQDGDPQRSALPRKRTSVQASRNGHRAEPASPGGRAETSSTPDGDTGTPAALNGGLDRLASTDSRAETPTTPDRGAHTLATPDDGVAEPVAPHGDTEKAAAPDNTAESATPSAAAKPAGPDSGAHLSATPDDGGAEPAAPHGDAEKPAAPDDGTEPAAPSTAAKQPAALNRRAGKQPSPNGRTPAPAVPKVRTERPPATAERAQTPAAALTDAAPLPGGLAQTPAVPNGRAKKPAAPGGRTKKPALPVGLAVDDGDGDHPPAAPGLPADGRPATVQPAEQRSGEPGPYPRRNGRRTNRRGLPSEGVPESRGESPLEGLADDARGGSAPVGRGIRGVARAGAEGDK